MMVRFFSLLLVIAMGADLALAQPWPSALRQVLRGERLSGQLTQGLAKFAEGGKKTLVAALVATTLILSVSIPSLAQDWAKVNARSEEHLKSTFYLLLDAGNLWRVMHVGYLGMNEDRKPLFVGLRAFIVVRDGRGVEHDILDEVEVSLVGYDGLIKQGVEIEVERVFAHPERRLLDIAVLNLAGVDLKEYRPINIDLWPMKRLTELEMLSYRLDLADNELGFFAYPAMRRSCVAGNFFVNQGFAIHSCVVSQNPFGIGSLIFVKESGTLVALHINENEDGLPYAVTAPPELVSMSLAVNPQQKATTLWGAIKSSH